MLFVKLARSAPHVGSLSILQVIFRWIVMQMHIAHNNVLLRLQMFEKTQHPLIVSAVAPSPVYFGQIVHVNLLIGDQFDCSRPVCDSYAITFKE